MFRTLRVAIVIGTLTYLSPLRQEGEGLRFEDLLAFGAGSLGVAPTATKAVAAFESLPEPARRALLDKLAAGNPGPLLPAPTDTLRPEDLRPPWRGGRPWKP
jgi:hypothetical protein